MGVGKSTFCNEILGEYVFSSGATLGSYTDVARAESGRFKGQPNEAKITCIDT